MCARCNRNKRKAEDAQQNFRGWFFNEYLKAAHPEGIIYGYASVTHIHVPVQQMSVDEAQSEAAGRRHIEGNTAFSNSESTSKEADVSGDPGTPTVPAVQVFVPLLQQARSCSLATLGLDLVSVEDAEKRRGGEFQGFRPVPEATVRAIRVRRAKQQDEHETECSNATHSVSSTEGGADCAETPFEGSMCHLPEIPSPKQSAQVREVSVAHPVQTLSDAIATELSGSACSCSGVAEGEEFTLQLFDCLRVRLLPGERQWVMRLCFD